MYHAKPSMHVIVVQLLVDCDGPNKIGDRDRRQNILNDIQKVSRLGRVQTEKVFSRTQRSMKRNTSSTHCYANGYEAATSASKLGETA